jgi:hypothetical protein
MFVIYGTRLMGKVDNVENLGYVSTQFFHLNFIPLIPTGSYLILAENGDDFRGVSIPLSFKSILVAWLRVGSFLAFIGCTVGALVSLGSNKQDILAGLACGAIALASIATFVATYYLPFFSKASYSRAMQIADIVGLSDEARLMLEVSYGQKTAEQADWELQQIEQRREKEVVVPTEYFN